MSVNKEVWAIYRYKGGYKDFYSKQYVNDLERGVWVTDLSCGKCSLKNFRINFNGDWTESLREVGIENN